MDNLEKTKEEFLLEIQELKQEIESLKISEQKFRALFESLPVGVSLADINCNIVESNSSAERILGLSASEQQQRAID